MRKVPKPKKQYISKLLIRRESCWTCVYLMRRDRCQCKARTYWNRKKRKWQYKPSDKRNLCEWHNKRYGHRPYRPYIKSVFPMSSPTKTIFHLNPVYGK